MWSPVRSIYERRRSKHGLGDAEELTIEAEENREPPPPNSGEPQPDNQNTRSAGLQGPLLIDDHHYLEKLTQSASLKRAISDKTRRLC